MPAWPLICGAGALLGFGFWAWAWVSRLRADRRFCPIEDEIGPVSLRHYAAVDCKLARTVAAYAQGLWTALRSEFPAETREGFRLDVIQDRQRGPEWRPWGEARVVINLAYCGKSDREIRGALAEALHHVVHFRRFGDAHYVFRSNGESDHPWLEEILYYALNPHETEALRFCVRATGDRAELLAEVEEYLRRRGSET